MYPGRHRFNDIDTIIDRVHLLFDEWEEQNNSTRSSVRAVHWAKLAVHEWLANLVQHADFEKRRPDIIVELVPNGESVRCIIEDNSAGFDLDGQLMARREVLNAFPDRGMGLLMLRACSDVLTYQQIKDGRHRLEFIVTTNHDPWFEIPFDEDREPALANKVGEV